MASSSTSSEAQDVPGVNTGTPMQGLLVTTQEPTPPQTGTAQGKGRPKDASSAKSPLHVIEEELPNPFDKPVPVVVDLDGTVADGVSTDTGVPLSAAAHNISDTMRTAQQPGVQRVVPPPSEPARAPRFQAPGHLFESQRDLAANDALYAVEMGEQGAKLGPPNFRHADWTDDHEYLGQLQPPIGKRLQHVLNFLAEEDVDRCIGFASKLAEVEAYLDWLEKEKWSGMSPGCREMVHDARDRIAAHKLFERHHYENRPFQPVVSELPKRSGRLPTFTSIPIALNRRLTRADAAKGLRRLFPRDPQIVNPLPYTNPELQKYWAKFYEDEAALWTAPAGTEPDEHNLAVYESKMYQHLIEKAKGVGGVNQLSGFNFQREELPMREPGEALAANRGANRAGLQLALRMLAGTENHAIATPWRQVALPVPARILDGARAVAAGPAYAIPALDRSEMPAQLDNMPYTFWSQFYMDWRRKGLALAREQLTKELGDRRGFLDPPREWAAPLVFGGIRPESQRRWDLLRECEVTTKLLMAAQEKAPRELLRGMIQWLEHGRKGSHNDIDKLQFLPGDLDANRDVKILDEDEMRMVRHLTGSSHPRAVFVAPDPEESGENEEKFVLYKIFALRLQKILDDPNPQCLFPNINTRVALEDLLAVMNTGTDGPVRRTKFSVWDALKWLDRLKSKGRIRFLDDPIVYGYVWRPEPDHHPENQVVWPEGRNERPKYPRDVLTWQQVAERGGARPIRNRLNAFFCTLAWRLGWTIHRLHEEKALWVKESQTGNDQMRTAMDAWQQLYNAEVAKDKDRLMSIVNVVRMAEPGTDITNMTEEEAVARMRDNIAKEGRENLVMLAPGRFKYLLGPDGLQLQTLVRDHHWHWAAASIRGQKRRFFSLDRWPVEFQTDKTQERIRGDKDVDPKMSWDPAAHYPVSPKWQKEKLQPYKEERVVYREYPHGSIFPTGDTKLQQAALKLYTSRALADEIGIDLDVDDMAASDPEIAKLLAQEPGHNKPSWSKRFSSILNPFSRPTPRVASRSFLPEVSPAQTPKSRDLAEVRQDREEVRHVPARRAAGIPTMSGANPAAGGARAGARVTFEDDEDVMMGGI